ncbi:MAG TPA: ABC transporter permease subunit [Streptosporangiaceae bacterium]|nr:ABC transporter permease subunit [Streptosporangiaceae bacterium]
MNVVPEARGSSTAAITPYQSTQPAGRDGFPQLLRSEWTKIRTVRAWVAAMIAAAVGVGLPIVALSATATDHNSIPNQPIGPGGLAVVDSFYTEHHPISADGSITARVTSLTGRVIQFQGASAPPGSSQPQPWAKAGVIIKAGTRPGSPYAAIMITPDHGVRFQYDFTGDVAGLAGSVSAQSPRWVRLTRSGDTITGYDSADGAHWFTVGSVRLAGLPATAEAGIFVASPDDFISQQGYASNDGVPYQTRATAAFDHIALVGGTATAGWRATQVGGPQGPAPAGPICGPGAGPHCGKTRAIGGQASGSAGSSTRSVTLSGNGDIAPYVPIVDPIGVTYKGSVVGLIVVIALAALFITSEYRRGLVRTTFIASPRRGRVLVAKAIVIGAVTFVAGLIGAAIAFPIAEHKLVSGGWPTPIYPVRAITSGVGLQIVIGTAALLAVAAVLTLAAGALLRRSTGAIAAGVLALIFPLVLATVLPQGPAVWLLRLTPAAAFGVQQGNVHYTQVTHACLPYNNCYPLAPWPGFAVLCAWALAALGLAIYVVRRRDA